MFHQNSGSLRATRPTLTLGGNSNVIDSYIVKFRASIESTLAYNQLVQECERYGHHALAVAARCVGDGAKDPVDGGMVVLDREAFVIFLKGDDDSAAMVDRYHAERLADLDEFIIPLAVTIKAAARKKLECEFAIWQAHARLIAAGLKEPRFLKRLDRSEEMQKLLGDDRFRL